MGSRGDEEREPFVLSEFAICIRDAEGTFQDRRARLEVRLQNSMAVSKMDLIQRNIVQGVNVVRRGAHALEQRLRHRPSLKDMISSNRLPQDYLDRVFPSDPERRVAPLADRIERVSLHRLLEPPSEASAARRPAATLDPAAVAAMFVQVAKMQPDRLGSQTWPAEVNPSFMHCATQPRSSGTVPIRSDELSHACKAAGSAHLPESAQRSTQGSVQAARLLLPTNQQDALSCTEAASAFFGAIGSTTKSAIGCTRTRAEPMFPQSSRSGPQRAKPPFVQLLDRFCDKVLSNESTSEHRSNVSMC